MFGLPVSTLVLIVCVAVFTLIVAILDLRTRRIPNKYTVPFFFAGWIYQIAFFGWAGVKEAGLAFLIGFGIMYVLWMVGSSGGGDVKLMGALSVWLGVKLTLWVLAGSVVFTVIGGFGVVLIHVFKRGPWRALDKFKAKDPTKAERRSHEKAQEARQQRRLMAFAVPVALATWLAIGINLLLTLNNPVG